ncbi:MAG: L,D-transpeptidase family protein [Candidatus Binatia bacterium]
MRPSSIVVIAGAAACLLGAAYVAVWRRPQTLPAAADYAVGALGDREATLPVTSPEDGTTAAIRQSIECGHRAPNEESRRRWRLLGDFYRRRAYRPAWSTPVGASSDVADLLAAVAAAERYALDPAAYGVTRAAMQSQESGEGGDAARARRDVELTRIFINYARDLSRGRVVHPDFYPANDPDAGARLETALAEHRIPEILGQMGPEHQGYQRLLAVIARYRRLAAAGEPPAVADGPRLKRGDKDGRVIALRSRLTALGDLPAAAPQGAGSRAAQVFDQELEMGLRNFQRRHGLEADGRLGSATLVALNVPVLDRTRQLELNLERWRWLPADLGERYVVVNIPDYVLSVIARHPDASGGGETTVMQMRVVVGVTEQPTPAMSASISHLILNPFWNIPGKIAEKELFPELSKDPGYLAKRQIKLVSRGADRRAVDPRSIDWRNSAWRENYRLRQEPGPGNAMGQLKFVLRNPFGVYLHDTPKRQLFARRKRAGSHGCIRVERPNELATYLLGGTQWTAGAIGNTLSSGTSKRIDLPVPIPVYLVYFTAWVGADGTVEFRDDVYREDAALDAALRREVGLLRLRACVQTARRESKPPPN